MMSGIRGKDTKPERLLRSGLHRRGFRFRLHAAGLPGRPDLLLPKHRAAIFVHGCFWHRHEGCRYATTPSTRAAFWQGKFQSNVTRDRANCSAIREAGWRLAIIWECALKGRACTNASIEQVADWLRGTDADLVVEGVEQALELSS